jgi:tRNA/tmRNA/rRNA uracil-C5-methylase (TrmA/RlmC/RlmD family)
MVFSQVNESMIPVFVQTAMDLLDPKPSTRVLDLYCGYGLFSFAAADAGAGSVWGMELEGPAVTAAISNANYLYPNKNMKFFAEAVTPDSLEEVLPFDDREEYVILDPPRSGTADGGRLRRAGGAHQHAIHRKSGAGLGGSRNFDNGSGRGALVLHGTL